MTICGSQKILWEQKSNLINSLKKLSLKMFLTEFNFLICSLNFGMNECEFKYSITIYVLFFFNERCNDAALLITTTNF